MYERHEERNGQGNCRIDPKQQRYPTPEMEEITRTVSPQKKGDRETLTNYRRLSISPTMSRFMGAVYGHQLRPILEHHYGPEQHGFRKGHSTVSLLHILEAVISSAMTNEEEAVIVQIDVAKAFDKVHRGAVQSFVKNIIAPIAPEPFFVCPHFPSCFYCL